jgi:hypothetical protein
MTPSFMPHQERAKRGAKNHAFTKSIDFYSGIKREKDKKI